MDTFLLIIFPFQNYWNFTIMSVTKQKCDQIKNGILLFILKIKEIVKVMIIKGNIFKYQAKNS